MKISKNICCYMILIALLVFPLGLAQAQQLADAGISDQEIEIHKEKVRELIAFVEYSFNAVGSARTPTREKDIIINQSFRKAFKDEKVQIEDDLVEDREVVTNKDVQAYLKDIDFFFKQVKFEFNVDEITHFLNENNQVTFKVALSRNLTGVSSEGKPVNSNKTRYIEVNLDQVQNDLKIASIYTTKMSESEALNGWWRGLSNEWKSFFRQTSGLVGAANEEALRKMKNLRKLDLSGNKYIADLLPLVELTQLKELDISQTKISDLAPLRNLTKLESFNCSYTSVSDLKPLRYAIDLRILNVSNSRIADFTIIENYPNLQMVNASNTSLDNLNHLAKSKDLKTLFVAQTQIKSLAPLKDLRKLVSVNSSNTTITNLAPLSGLTRLERLNIENTQIKDLAPLQSTGMLKTLYCDNTQVGSLQPLKKLKLLERIYCDNTLITNNEAKAFMLARPKVLVIFGSEDLKSWWGGLSTDWRSVFKKHVKIDQEGPTKEQFAAIASLKSMDLSGDPHILSLQPLSVLRNLRRLKANQTGVTSLAGLEGLLGLEILEVRETKISDLGPLRDLESLKKISIDRTPVSLAEIKRFSQVNRSCLIVYRTDQLGQWWLGLDDNWQSVLRQQMMLKKVPSAEQLHMMVNLEKVVITNNSKITDLRALSHFSNLEELEFTGTQVTSLAPLSRKRNLKRLNCSGNPISDLSPIAALNGLTFLDCSNTPVEDLSTVENLMQLKELRFSGTQVKDLKPLRLLSNLKELDCFNTEVKGLKDLKLLYNLKSLKCYNTRLSRRNVDDFKKTHPRCEVIYY
ncbi:MAG: leucine-rich repeat domain-containing protein [Cyclobacteriaceae bacterium]